MTNSNNQLATVNLATITDKLSAQQLDVVLDARAHTLAALAQAEENGSDVTFNRMLSTSERIFLLHRLHTALLAIPARVCNPKLPLREAQGLCIHTTHTLLLELSYNRIYPPLADQLVAEAQLVLRSYSPSYKYYSGNVSYPVSSASITDREEHPKVAYEDAQLYSGEYGNRRAALLVHWNDAILEELEELATTATITE